jgi:predicted Zn-dependent protease
MRDIMIRPDCIPENSRSPALGLFNSFPVPYSLCMSLPRPRRPHRAAPASIALIAGALLIAACTTVPDTGRKQFNPLSADTEMRMGLTEFQKIKSKMKVSQNPTYNAQVQRVASRLTPVIPLKNAQWEFVVFEDPSPNAFALPGGKVGIHTGIFQITQNDAGLAAVVGHEIGHVVARHSGERITQAIGASLITLGVNQALKNSDARNAATLGTGAATSLTVLKFSRSQELESDQLGALYMARAGYNPNESVKLWERFAQYKNKKGGGSMPQFLSTHPLDATRIERLKAFMPEAYAVYQGRSNTNAPRALPLR